MTEQTERGDRPEYVSRRGDGSLVEGRVVGIETP
jgi:hypothetical protein